VLKKLEGKSPTTAGVIKTWSRACQIAPEMVGFTFGVHNGKEQKQKETEIAAAKAIKGAVESKK